MRRPTFDIQAGYYTRDRLRNPPAHWTPLLVVSYEKQTQPSRPLIVKPQRRRWQIVPPLLVKRIREDLNLPEFLTTPIDGDRIRNFMRGSNR